MGCSRLKLNIVAFDSDGVGGDEEASLKNIDDLKVDKNNAPTSIIISAGAKQADLVLTPIPDNYMFVLPGKGYEVDPERSVATTILQDSPLKAGKLPIVSVIGKPSRPVKEDEGVDEKFLIKLSKPAPKGGLKLNISAFDSDGLGGDEEASLKNIDDLKVDKNNAPVSVVISGGAKTAQLILTPQVDGVKEGTEVNYFTILPGKGYVVDPAKSTAITILEDGKQSKSASRDAQRDEIISRSARRPNSADFGCVEADALGCCQDPKNPFDGDNPIATCKNGEIGCVAATVYPSDSFI